MKRVHVIADASKIVDYTLFPLRVNKIGLFNRNYNVKIFYDLSPKSISCDILLLISKPVLSLLNEKSPVIKENDPTLMFIKCARQYASKIIWLDNSDSTTVTHFELLPFIDYYLKKQLLKDKSLYSKEMVGGRIFTDYYHKKFNLLDNMDFDQVYPLDNKFINKVGLAWNIGLCDAYNAFTKKDLIRRKLFRSIPFKYHNKFISPNNVRISDFFIRTSFNLSRKLIAFHRQELLKRLEEIINKNNLVGSTKGPRLSTKKFRNELANSKILPSPFGWGELGIRDYEAFIFGALLLKPDISHMETWPAIFIENETYKPFKWDFSDLELIILQLLENNQERLEIAESGQQAYANSISQEGMEKFCDFFVKQIER